MQNLDDVAAFSKLDPKDVLGSIGLFPKQCRQAWKESRSVVISEEYKKVRNIVVCGMGGSRFTPRTVKELFRDRITVPYEIVEDYDVPQYVNEHTLVILSSYSGTTEEVIAAGKDAQKKGAKIAAVALGGAIASWVKENNYPAYLFTPTHNPCGQPRVGGGYLLFGHIGLLVTLGFLDVNDTEVEAAIAFAEQTAQKYVASVDEANNQAKQLARLLYEKHPVIVAAEFLKGFANGFANQINENAKMISDVRFISELNHHLMEGLKHPETLHQNGLFVFIRSSLYHPSILKRFGITKTVVEKQQVKTHEITLLGSTKFAQVLEAFTLSGFSTFYLAALYDADPVAIPWVDYFKAELART